MIKAWLRDWLNVEDRNFTDVLVDAYTARAADVGQSDSLASYAQGVVETCSGYMSRGFAAATYTPDIPRWMLSEIGRRLVLRGESIWHITGAGDSLQFRVVSGYEFHRNYYRLTFADPDRLETISASVDSVLHFRWSIDPTQPWRGIGPIHRSYKTMGLITDMERHLNDEARSVVGNILPSPLPGQDSSMIALMDSLRSLRGRTVVVQSSRVPWGAGNTGASGREWQTSRLGADIDAAMVTLRRDLQETFLSTCGVPLELVYSGEGSAKREAWRIFLASTVSPLCALVAEELERVFRTPVEFELNELKATDIATRARAFQSLTGGGMPPSAASEEVGFDFRGEGTRPQQQGNRNV